MSDNRSSRQFLEEYVNRCYANNIATRWWAMPYIVIGGSICDRADCEHLARDFKVGAVISVETEHEDCPALNGLPEYDHGPACKLLPEIPAFRFAFPDDGTPPGYDTWARIFWAGMYLWGKRQVPDRANAPVPFVHVGKFPNSHGDRVYVHCQQGGSRSPAVAYFLMRAVVGGYGPADALDCLRGYKTDYGDHPYHKAYLADAEAAIARGF